MIHGFKLLDYFSYCKHRFNNRQVAWMASNYNLDKSLDINYRSLDNLNFSDQFYFMSSIIIYGIFCLTLGLSIIIRNEYVFFSDPVIYPMVFLLSVVIIPANIVIRFIWNKLEYWKIKIEKEKTPLISTEDVLSQQMENIEQIMEIDVVRKHFVQCNKEWIIKNMKEFLVADNFYDNDDYLLNIYKNLVNDTK